MPSENDRPRQPEVAMPRAGWSWSKADHAVERRDEDAGAQLVARREMDRDVAAVVDIRLVECTARDQGLQHLVGDRAGDRRHRRDVDAR